MATLDDRLKDDDYRHWVKAVLCLQYTKDGLVSLASNKSQDLHNAVLAQMRHSGNPCTNGICRTARIDFRRRAFTCCANCNAFLVETKKHCIGTLNLSNIDITHLHDQPWQIAKLFMNPGQDITTAIPGQTDLSGILNFFDHCTLAKAAILNTANVNAVRDIRNMILHTADMKITKHDFSTKIVPTLIALLQDPWFLSRDQVAQDAVVKLNEVAAAGFHITKENEEKVLKDLTTEVRCFSKDLNTKIDNLQTELNRVETNVGQEMKTQEDKLKQELQDRDKQTRQDMSTKIDDLRTDLNRVETNIGQEMKTQQDKLGQELKERKKDKQMRQDLSTKIDDLQTELNRVETNVGQEVKTQQDKLEQELQDREKDKQTLEKLVQTLEQKVEYDTELVTTLDTDVNTIKSSLEETRQGIDKLTSKIKLVEETCDRKHRQLEEEWKGKHAEMAADIDDLNMRVTKTEAVSITEDDKAQLQQYLKDGYDNNKLDVPVLSTCHGLPISEIFAPVILTANTEPALKQGTRESEKLHSYKAMFFKENVLQKKLFLLGKAGAGKSTFCKHLCDIWCNDKMSPQFSDAGIFKQFRYLFNVSCRFAEASESIFDMIRNQLFCENDEMIKVACHVLKNTPDECLVVVDGIDEWKGSTREVTGRRGDIPGLPSRKGLEGCVVLSTSRPERIHMLPVKLDDTCSVFELHGIKNAEELICSILEKVEDPNPGQSCSKFLSQIRQSNMADLIQFPLMLINALNIWDRNESLSNSMCVNYSNMVEGLFLCAKEANRIEEYEQKREKENFAELPDCFIDTDLCKQNAGLIIKLGKLAFDLLFNDDQNLSLIFSGQQTRKYLTEIELKTSLAIGILSKAQTISRSRREIDSFSFCHKTFQEFLGALWLSTEQSKIMCMFLRRFRSTDTLLYNGVFIKFLCGLSPSTGGKFWQYIVDEVIEKDKEIINMRLKAHICYDLRNKICMLQDLVLRCIKEARSSDREQHQQFYYFFPDVNIDEYTDERDITLIEGMMEKFVTDIKYVALTNNIPSKIVKLMKKMKSAIAIALHGESDWSILRLIDKKTMPELCSDSQEVPVLQFSQEVPVLQFPHQLKTLKISNVAMTTSEVEFPLHLTTLVVNDTKLPHRVIEQLFSSNLQDLCLESLHCSDHGHSCLPALDLQKHLSLEKVKLKRLSVKSVLMPGQGTIPLHLTTLTVSSIHMSHSGIAQFCSWFGDSSTLKYLKLQILSCSDHHYSCSLPALDLQKHHSLEEVKLKGLSVKSVLMPGLETIPLHLTKLTVSSIQMSHSGIAQFCSWFGDSSTLKYLELKSVSCSDHGDSCCLPALDLQKHHSLAEEVKLEGLPVKSVLMPGQETIPLHLTKLTVSSIQMSHSGIAQFCSWFGVSSTLERLELRDLSCSDHGDSCCFPALDLQKHLSLKAVFLKSISVDSVLLPGQLERHQTSGLHEIPLMRISLDSMSISMISVNMSPQGWKRLPLSHRLHVNLIWCNIDKDFRSYIRSCSHFKVINDYAVCFGFWTIEGE